MNDVSTLLDEVSKLEQRVYALKTALREKFNEEVPTGEMTLLLLDASEECLGIPLQYVEEVLPMCKLANFPEGPPWIPGMLNLHGAMLPVIDVTARTKREKRTPEVSDFVVVCNINHYRLGLCVQKVNDIFQPQGADLERVSPEIPLAPYVLGFFQHQQEAVYLLSLKCLVETSMLPKETAKEISEGRK